MSDDVDGGEPWLPVPVVTLLYLGSAFVGAIAIAALVESPAVAVGLLRDPGFYVVFALGGGGGLLLARLGWRE
jgi:hypothetical protein